MTDDKEMKIMLRKIKENKKFLDYMFRREDGDWTTAFRYLDFNEKTVFKEHTLWKRDFDNFVVMSIWKEDEDKKEKCLFQGVIDVIDSSSLLHISKSKIVQMR
jgi:hypothetical protein